MEGVVSREESKVLKGMAILTVIIQHANIFSVSLETVPILNNTSFVTLLAEGGMCLFMILSGYGVCTSFLQKGFNGYWDAKFDKVFLPAAFIQTVWALAKLRILRNWNVPGNEIFGSVINTNQNNALDISLWFLSYLLFCYMSFYVFFKYIKSRKCAIFLFLLLWTLATPIIPKMWIYSFYLPLSFPIGVVYALLVDKYRFTIPDKLSVVLLLAAIATTIVHFFHLREISILEVLAGNILAIGMVLFVKLFQIKKSRILTFLGVHSYSLYLLQGKIIFGIFPYYSYSDNIRLLAFLIFFALCIPIACLFDMFIRRLRGF